MPEKRKGGLMKAVVICMEDQRIIELYNLRDETAIAVTSEKYGAYCFAVANNILSNEQDSEECVNDTYVKAWNAIPPARPAFLRPFLAKITRHIAIDRYRSSVRAKRGGYEVDLALEELGEVVSDGDDIASELERKALIDAINRFLRDLPPRDSNVFIRRYFYAESVNCISGRYGMNANHISQILSRTRHKLKKYLESEGHKI